MDRLWYEFPTDRQFRDALTSRGLFQLRVCKHVLERLENDGRKVATNTGSASVEHVMPQDVRGSGEWREMLGGDWEAAHETWLHRLGNLTLTGYNSELSNRPFLAKRDMKNGFRESPFRLNRDIGEQGQWTATEIGGAHASPRRPRAASVGASRRGRGRSPGTRRA